MMKMKSNDPSHARLIKAVEAVHAKSPLEQRRNPNAVAALAIKIMTRDRNPIQIPASYKKTSRKRGYRHWQDVMVQLFRQWKG